MRLKNLYDYYEFNRFVAHGTLLEISNITGIPKRTLEHYVQGSKHRQMIEVGQEYPAYAFYDGEHLIKTGTLKQIAEATGLFQNTLRWYMNPSARSRSDKSVIRLEGETVRVRHTTFDHKAYKRAQVREKEEQKEIKKVPAKKSEWHPSEHTKYLFNINFKKWGVEA